MPKAIKKRVSRKSGSREDEVKGKALNTFNFLKEKSRTLVYTLSALGFIIVVVAGVMIYAVSEKRKAYAVETEAYSYYYNMNIPSSMSAQQRFEKALELFQKSMIIKSTPTALFYAGNSYFNLNDYDNAVATYHEFIDKYSDEDVIIPLVYQKLTSAYFKKGENSEAINTLNRLAQFRNEMFKDIALIREAKYYESTAADNTEEAMKKYKELASEFPTSPWASEAMAKIERQGSKGAAGSELSVPLKEDQGGIEKSDTAPEPE
jgi:tetratricopeptide (TPR) repeat protein